MLVKSSTCEIDNKFQIDIKIWRLDRLRHNLVSTSYSGQLSSNGTLVCENCVAVHIFALLES